MLSIAYPYLDEISQILDSAPLMATNLMTSRHSHLLLGLGLLVSIVLSGTFSGCEERASMGPLAVRVTLTQPLGELSEGTYDLELSLPSAADPSFRLKAPDHAGANGASVGKDILVIPQSSFTVEPSYSTENREGVDTIHGDAANGTEITGKLLSSLTISASAPDAAGHRSVSNATLYRFSGEIKKDAQSLGEIQGRKVVAW
jgi:hypothetical protein